VIPLRIIHELAGLCERAGGFATAESRRRRTCPAGILPCNLSFLDEYHRMKRWLAQAGGSLAGSLRRRLLRKRDVDHLELNRRPAVVGVQDRLEGHAQRR